jgi:hypothetical protein
MAWAGSQEDPFGLNSQMDNEIATIWSHVYSDLELNGNTMPIIHSMVCDFLRTDMAHWQHLVV